MPQDTSILASTLIARIFGYHFSLFDEFWFIDMARKRPFGNDFYFNILGFVLSRFFLRFCAHFFYFSGDTALGFCYVPD
jgi:hypothetical protein